MSEITLPEFDLSAFHCPHCGVYARQSFFNCRNYNQLRIDNLYISDCESCDNLMIWYNQKIVYPSTSSAPMPNKDMPESIKKDYEEARSIIELSPRGACALLRLCIEQLCVYHGGTGKNINEDLKILVSKGFPERVIQQMDMVRVFGNKGVHDGGVFIEDNPEIASFLFHLINRICEKTITEPKEEEVFYNMMPASAIKAIETRNIKSVK